MFSKIINLQEFNELYTRESDSEDKTTTVRRIIEINEMIEAEFLSTILNISTRKKSPYRIFKQRRYKQLLVNGLEQIISYSAWIKNKEFYKHNMKPLKDEIYSFLIKITDEIRMVKERITSLNCIFVSIIALVVSVGAIIFSILW